MASIHGLLLNDAAACAASVLEYVNSGEWLSPRYRPQTLQEFKNSRVTKLEIPGCGTCVLKELLVNHKYGWYKQAKAWWRITFEQKFRRTFKVSLAMRRAGISVSEPFATWICTEKGVHEYFLCKFVEGDSFESLCREMRYPPESRGRVLALFSRLGEMAARMHENGIIDSDMIPRNCIITSSGAGDETLTLIDLDSSYFVMKLGRRFVFDEEMRSFKKFVSYYPLNDECLTAFLLAYSRGDSAKAGKCREVLEYFRKHHRHCSPAAWLAMLLFSPPAL